ncbi:hypothetical protein JCM6882_002225 [Rhodosporidiobolus microsporus]
MDEEPALKATNKLVLDWKIENINAALAAAKAGEDRSFERGEKAQEGYAAVWIYAVPDELDYEQATATKKWVRTGKWNITFEFFTVAGAFLHHAFVMKDKSFEASHGWGSRKGLPWDTLASLQVADQNAFLIRCTIEGKRDPLYGSHSPPSLPSFGMLYDNPKHADLVFRLEPTDGEPLHLLALKNLVTDRSCYYDDLFDSGFSESRERVNLDLKELLTNPESPYAGDADEFAAFETDAQESALQDGAQAGAGTKVRKAYLHTRRYLDEDSPSPSQSPSARPQQQQPQNDGEPSAATEQEQDSEPLKKKRKTSSTTTPSVWQVTVKDCSFATFDSFLYYLYTTELTLTPSPSDYLVALSSASKPSKFAPRDEWLEKKSKSHYSSHLCHPHALYRLADRLCEEALKTRVKSFILRSLTVENVAYEAFSQLSIDFPTDFQKPVIAFLLENWNDVKSTTAFARALALIEAGSLPGGAAVLKAIFDGMTSKEGEGKTNTGEVRAKEVSGEQPLHGREEY